MGKFIDITGQIFGQLTVLYRQPSFVQKGSGAYWMCRCACGDFTTVSGSNLKTGSVKGCGCLRGQDSRPIHGMTASPEYNSWHAMKSRCLYPSHEAYHRYGGRGITICDRWLNSFENFYADLGPRPEGTTLERINNNDGYHKDNCKWATRKEQSNNTCTNKKTHQPH